MSVDGKFIEVLESEAYYVEVFWAHIMAPLSMECASEGRPMETPLLKVWYLSHGSSRSCWKSLSINVLLYYEILKQGMACVRRCWKGVMDWVLW